MSGMMYPIALRNAASVLPLFRRMPSHSGVSTESNDSMPYGAAASASAEMASADASRTFCDSSSRPFLITSTSCVRCGRTAQPLRIAICCTMRMPVCRAFHDFFDLVTAPRKGSSAGTPCEAATTAKQRLAVLRTCSSSESMSGRSAEIMAARPAALDRLEMISRASMRA